MILPKPYFLHQLWLEKRRADRSNSPFSLALFYFKQGRSVEEEWYSEMLSSINSNTRETDIKGWVDQDVLGLILPDTDGQGVQSCVNKVVNGSSGKALSVVVGTYPDHIIKELLGEEQKNPNFFPLDIDETIKPIGFKTYLKRAIDVIGSIAGLLLSSPIMILTGIVIKINSPGPIIFKQMRLGEKGVPFSFYKFRSMNSNTDDQIHREYTTKLINGNLSQINQGDESAPLYKMKSDPRVTWVGKIIRKTSIDELPQFLNVLKGEMSLVGPRPPIFYEVEKYEPWQLRRILEVKPGITGLWQVDGRSRTSFDDMVRLDLRYARTWSIWLDFKILLKTVKAVIRPNGAL